MAAITLFKTSMLRPSLSRMASTVNSAVFQKFGCPCSVLKVQKTQLKPVTSKDVQVRMVASPITSFDLEAIRGQNPMGFAFPTVAGNEGVGIIEQLGEDVTTLNNRDTVLLVKPSSGTWSEEVVVPADSVMKAPEGIAPEIASSLLYSAGIAYRLLADFGTLNPGDFLIQNDASSAVGMAVIQLCKARGIKTINIVKDVGEYSALFRRLESLGADVVVRESQLHGVDFKKIMQDLPAPKLALNGRGGCVMTDMCRLLKNATVVTYDESAAQAFDLTASYFTVNNLCLKGFNMKAWLAGSEMNTIKAMVDDLAGMVRADDLRLYLKKDKFSQVVDAVAEASSAIADRTPVMVMNQ